MVISSWYITGIKLINHRLYPNWPPSLRINFSLHVFAKKLLHAKVSKKKKDYSLRSIRYSPHPSPVHHRFITDRHLIVHLTAFPVLMILIWLALSKWRATVLRSANQIRRSPDWLISWSITVFVVQLKLFAGWFLCGQTFQKWFLLILVASLWMTFS